MNKEKLFFTKSAMQVFSRIVLSCPPTFPKEAGLRHEKIIVNLAKEGRNVSLGEIEEVLGRKVTLYDDIADYVSSLGKNFIDDGIVIGYFGGKRHIDKIVKEFDQL